MTFDHTKTDSYVLPVTIVGTVALDILHFWDQAHETQTGVRVEIGGVCKHVACTMGALGVETRFVSTRYPGELGGVLSGLLTANRVDWRQLNEVAPFSLFEAQLDPADQVFAESFVEGESIALLTPDRLRQQPALADARIIVTCTNLTVHAMNELAAMAADQGAHFWLLTSSLLEAQRIGQIGHPIDLLSLNSDELQDLVGRPLDSLAEVGSAARHVTSPGGRCLVTLGSRGALLAHHESDQILYQPVRPIRGRSPVGGGDVLFSSLLVGRIQGQAWDSAFSFAASATRRYLMRDPSDPNPYHALTLADSREEIPPLERIPLPHGR